MTEHLYELADRYRFLESEVRELELTPGDDGNQIIFAALNAIKDKLDNKVENIGKFILSLKASVAGIEAEEHRLSDRKTAINQRIDWLKNYLLNEMTVAKIDKVKRDIFTVSLRTNPPSVHVLDETIIPKEYQHIIPESWQPDKKDITDHFKATGEIIPGVEIIKDKKSVVIR